MCRVRSTLVAATILIATSPTYSQDRTVEIAGAIAAIETHYKRFDRFSMSFESLDYTDSGQFRPESHEPSFRRKLKVLRDPPRWYESGYVHVWDSVKKQWDASPEDVGERLFDGSKVWRLGKEPFDALSINDSKSRPALSKFIKYSFDPLFSGQMDYSGDDGLVKILRDSPSVSLRFSDGNNLIIEGVSKWGKYGVWLDTERGHSIAKITLEKGRADWFAPNMPSSTIQVSFLPKNPRVVGYRVTLSVSKWEKRGAIRPC